MLVFVASAGVHCIALSWESNVPPETALFVVLKQRNEEFVEIYRGKQKSYLASELDMNTEYHTS